MQAANKAIQNPLYFACFFGTIPSLSVSTCLTYFQHQHLRFWLLLTATIIYLIGVFGVTVFGNIPLNDGLKNFNLASVSKETITWQMTIFKQGWNSRNIVRTMSLILSLVLIGIAGINLEKSSIRSKIAVNVSAAVTNKNYR